MKEAVVGFDSVSLPYILEVVEAVVGMSHVKDSCRTFGGRNRHQILRDPRTEAVDMTRPLRCYNMRLNFSTFPMCCTVYLLP